MSFNHDGDIDPACDACPGDCDAECEPACPRCGEPIDPLQFACPACAHNPFSHLDSDDSEEAVASW